MNAKVLFPTKRASRLLAGAVAMLFFSTAFSGPAWAITGGEVDEDNTYSNVGAVVAAPPIPGLDPFVWFSATLIHPRVLLTAGHATTLLDQYPERIPYCHVSFGTYALDPSTWLEIETAITHPDFQPANAKDTGNPPYYNDVGVIILKKPVNTRKVPLARLPYEGFVDELKAAGLLRRPGQGAVPLIVVGYGTTLEWPPPVIVPGDGWRRFAQSDYLVLTPAWLFTLMNLATGNGGTGYGDSGGPAFWVEPDGTLVVVAVTSRGDPNCVATNIAWRTDIPETLDFITQVIQGLEQ